MLSAIKDNLKTLAVDPKDPFHSKVKRRIGKRATNMLEHRLKQLILIMPSLLKRIHYHWNKEDVDQQIKNLGSFLFAYLYHPYDFLPEEEHGLFGYLDDAYLVSLVYERVMNHLSFQEEVDQDFLALIRKNMRYLEAVIPDESQKISEMVDKALITQNFDSFAEAFSL